MNFDFDDEMLKEINEKVDLLSLVEEYIPLDRKGKDYFGKCPKHVDNTPSFSVTPDKHAYYCFSCGRSGGAIGFLMDYGGMSLEDAVKKAAQYADVNLGNMCHARTITFLRKFKQAKIDSKPQPFTHLILPYSEYTNKYYKDDVTEWRNEGISKETLDRFDVRIDRANNAIVYPVLDMKGRLINIKARTRNKNYKAFGAPKYMNYKKIGVMDYFQGLNFALPYIKEQGEVIIFESFKSVMKVYDWGVKNSVSAEKHTLTKEQIFLLARLHVSIVFAYDSDISYWDKDVKKDIDKLKGLTDVYVIEDKGKLLGGKEAKNSPADCGEEIWRKLYETKRKIT